MMLQATPQRAPDSPNTLIAKTRDIVSLLDTMSNINIPQQQQQPHLVQSTATVTSPNNNNEQNQQQQQQQLVPMMPLRGNELPPLVPSSSSSSPQQHQHQLQQYPQDVSQSATSLVSATSSSGISSISSAALNNSSRNNQNNNYNSNNSNLPYPMSMMMNLLSNNNNNNNNTKCTGVSEEDFENSKQFRVISLQTDEIKTLSKSIETDFIKTKTCETQTNSSSSCGFDERTKKYNFGVQVNDGFDDSEDEMARKKFVKTFSDSSCQTCENEETKIFCRSTDTSDLDQIETNNISTIAFETLRCFDLFETHLFPNLEKTVSRQMEYLENRFFDAEENLLKLKQSLPNNNNSIIATFTSRLLLEMEEEEERQRNNFVIELEQQTRENIQETFFNFAQMLVFKLERERKEFSKEMNEAKALQRALLLEAVEQSVERSRRKEDQQDDEEQNNNNNNTFDEDFPSSNELAEEKQHSVSPRAIIPSTKTTKSNPNSKTNSTSLPSTQGNRNSSSGHSIRSRSNSNSAAANNHINLETLDSVVNETDQQHQQKILGAGGVGFARLRPLPKMMLPTTTTTATSSTSSSHHHHHEKNTESTNSSLHNRSSTTNPPPFWNRQQLHHNHDYHHHHHTTARRIALIPQDRNNFSTTTTSSRRINNEDGNTNNNDNVSIAIKSLSKDVAADLKKECDRLLQLDALHNAQNVFSNMI